MLFDLIKDKNVAIVGPSSFLENKKKGKLIDSYDIVIKINRFNELSADDYGKKVDILFHNFYQNLIPNNLINSYNTKLVVGAHSFKHYPQNKKTFERSKKIYSNILHEYYPEKELNRDIKNLINKNKWKSSGFWIISLLFQKINLMKQLHIFGMDFCFNKYNKQYNPTLPIGRKTPGHDMKKELYLFKKLFQNFIENKKIVIEDKEFLKYLLILKNDIHNNNIMVKIISEVGINHNGSMELCKKLIILSKVAGADYVKIQKRNPDVCVPEKQKTERRMTPWGEMSYLEYKYRIEFSEEQIKELCEYSKSLGIEFFASVWDVDSAKLMSKYTRIAKLGSASITDRGLCKITRELFDFVIISTGMSTEEEVEQAISDTNPDVIMHTNSTYPCPVDDLNLRYIEHLKEKFGKDTEIGWSGHEYGLVTSFAAVAMGATWVERHVTLDRNMWGSDQKSSIEPSGLIKLVKGIRDIEKATQYEPGPRKQFLGESAKRDSLRKI